MIPRKGPIETVHGQVYRDGNWRKIAKSNIAFSKDNRAQLYPEHFPHVKVPQNWTGELIFSPEFGNENDMGGIFSLKREDGQISSFFGPNIYKPRNKPRSRDEVEYWVEVLERKYPEGIVEPMERKLARLQVLSTFLKQEEVFGS